MAIRLLLAAVAAACMAGTGPTARAADLVLGGHAGYGSYTQDDLNELIRYINAGTSFQNEIKGGAEYGALIGLRFRGSFLLGVAYSRLALDSSGTNGRERSEVSAPADCWLACANWLPDNDKIGRIGLGADAGLVGAQGFIEFVDGGGVSRRVDYDGSGLFLAGYVVADIQFTGRLSGCAHAGFRLAKITNVDLNGEPPDDVLDYSGAFVRVGLQVHLGGEPR